MRRILERLAVSALVVPLAWGSAVAHAGDAPTSSSVASQPDHPTGPEPLSGGELSSNTFLFDRSGTPFEAFNPDVVAGSLNSRFAAIQAWMDDAQLRIAKDETDMATADARIQALEAQVLTLQATLASSTTQAPAGPTADQFAKLQSRVANLEKNRSRVTAPFKVVDGNGTSILEVNSEDGGGTRGLTLLNSDNQLVMFAAAVGSGGVVQVLDAGHKSSFVDMVATDGSLSVKATPDGGATGANLTVKDTGVTSLQMTGPNGIAATIDGTKDGGSMSVYDKSGTPVVVAESNGVGGVVRATKDGDDGTSVAMGVTDGEQGIRVRGGGKSKAFLGTQPDGSGVAYVFGSTDAPVAGLQSYQGGKGEIAVFNASGTPIAFLDESDKHPGGGNVTVTDPAGNGVFSAGFDGDEGSACVGHKQQLHCLGIGLPGMGTGND